MYQIPAKLITAPTIRTPFDLQAALSNSEIILHLDVDWSVQALVSRPVIVQLREVLAHDPQLQHIVIRRIDCTEQRGELWNALSQSLHVDDSMTAGGGAIVWIKSGTVIDSVINAADVGVDQLVARTRSRICGEITSCRV